MRAPGAGIQSLRTSASWATIEESQGTFDFSNLDRTLSQAGTNGLDVILTFSQVPGWTADPISNWETFRSQYYSFVLETITHTETVHPGLVTAYSAWNEPNFGSSWTVDQYVGLLDKLYDAAVASGEDVSLFGPETLHMYAVDPDGTYFASVLQQRCGFLDVPSRRTSTTTVIPATLPIRCSARLTQP